MNSIEAKPRERQRWQRALAYESIGLACAFAGFLVMPSGPAWEARIAAALLMNFAGMLWLTAINTAKKAKDQDGETVL